MEQAGWKDSDGDGLLDKNGKPFKVSMIASNLYEEGTTIAEAIQVQLRKIGSAERNGGI